jgi:dienelactone hydrolase
VYLHGSGGANESAPRPYGGIGVQLQANPLRIQTTFANSPAEAAGLRAGDEIIAIDGTPSAQLTIPEAMPLLRGEEGSSVSLTVVGPERPRPEEVAVVRAVIGSAPPSSLPMPFVLTRDLAEQGFVTLAISYFALTPSPGPDPGSFDGSPPEAYTAAFPTWLQVVGDGVTFLQSQPEVDPARIGLVGWSRGAQVGLRSAIRDGRYSAVVEISGQVPEQIRADAARLPRLLILHGTDDQTNAVAHAFGLRDALEAAGHPYEIEIYPNGDHFWRDQQGQVGFNRIVTFLRQTLAAE